jgi:hypothetical protein
MTQQDRGEGPLRGIEKVDWSRLGAAYGPAVEVPGLLEAVARGPETARRQAMNDLWGTVWHQGTVYEATADAVPFLASLAADEGVPLRERASLLYLLASIAAGSGYLQQHRSFGQERNSQDEEQMRLEQTWVVSARRAVQQALSETLNDAGQLPAEIRAGLFDIAHHLGTDAAAWVEANLLRDGADVASPEGARPMWSR